MSDAVDVTNVEEFQTALETLKGSTHGDTLAIYLALKRHQDRLPTLGDAREGVPSGALEDLLDEFYTKRHRQLSRNNGKVCRIFADAFTPPNSYNQNNWRDFFRYALGIGCLAPESEFTSAFLGQHRSDCPHLVPTSGGTFGCSLHPKRTKYIRGLDKPKLLKWTLERPTRGSYKLVNINDPCLVEFIRPLANRVPLDPLIVALYFGGTWSGRSRITIDQFVADFHFQNREQVEFLFATEVADPALRRSITRSKQELISKLQSPFMLREEHRATASTMERLVRSKAFTEAIREAYGYACAVCGLKLDSIEGQWEVQAAHIFDHALGGSDDIRNGIALCRTHHWAFDQNLFTIGERYELIWHRRVVGTRTYRQGIIHLPQGVLTWPDQQQALAWHRERTRNLWGARRAPKRSRSAPQTEYP